MKDKTILDLVRRASQQGDREAFVEICNKKAREVIFLCIREMGNSHDGEDAAQEVFIRMQASITQLKAPEAFNVWLNRLVYTTCMNMKRDSMKHKDALAFESFDDSLLDDSEFALPQSYAEDADKRRRMIALINDLPDKYRNCIVLHYYQHLSYAEIAEVLDISTDSVNNNMRMARKFLKLEIENDQEQVGGVKVFSAAPLVALGPVLSTVLQESALSTVTTAMMEKCLAAAGIVAAVAGGTAAAGGAGAAVAAGGVAKAVATIAITSSLVLGGGAAALYAVQGTNPIAPAPVVQSIAPPQSAEAAVGAALPAEEPDFAGRVYLSAEGASAEAADGLAEVELTLTNVEDRQQAVRVLTGGEDDPGAFRFYGLAPGEYQLSITLPQEATALENGITTVKTGRLSRQTGTVFFEGVDTFYVDGAGSVAGVEIALHIPSELSGRIGLFESGREIDYDSGLLPGVEMHLIDPDGNLVATTSVSDTGAYLFENPLISQRGAYTLHLEVEEDAEINLEVEDVQIELYPGYHN